MSKNNNEINSIEYVCAISVFCSVLTMQDRYHEVYDKLNILIYIIRMLLRVFLIILNKNILILLF